jgi:transitional endoplasmic reticulum ATPase
LDPVLELRVIDAFPEDVGKGLARVVPDNMEAIRAGRGDVVEIHGMKRTVNRIAGMPLESDRAKSIQIDAITRSNLGVKLGDLVTVRKLPRQTADTIIISSQDPKTLIPDPPEMERLSTLLQGIPVIEGDSLNISAFSGIQRLFRVESTFPKGGVIITRRTRLTTAAAAPDGQETQTISYGDVGGLSDELKRLREVVELPLRYSELFEKLGIEAPKGVLLYGPPGTGKTLIARAIAGATKLPFIHVSGPEIINKFYGESEARLREIFEEANRSAPSIVFLDEIDAIAPRRADVLGDVEKRVVAQLLALMDGLVSRGHVIVIGATNIPEVIDPALRRPGRFDREIMVPIPNKQGRREILEIQSRRMPLHKNVDLNRLAEMANGYVGADLEALCKEAGMVAVRRYISRKAGDEWDSLPGPEAPVVLMEDFLAALRGIEPTAIREFHTERPSVKWSQVGGLSELKEVLISTIEWPRKYPALFSSGRISPAKAILFTGPSGTGKTLMANALAGETGLSFISINGPILFSKWLGESEKELHRVFKKAKQSAPCLLFFDEIDAVIPSRGSAGAGSLDRMASQFLIELDNLSDSSEVIVLGATNREDLIDPALLHPGRFDHLLRFRVPSEKDRLEIFQIHTRERPLSPDVDLKALVQATEGMVGCQIASICNDAALIAIGDLIEAPDEKREEGLCIRPVHFHKALKRALGTGDRIHAESD